jgi:hypothetical protein
MTAERPVDGGSDRSLDLYLRAAVLITHRSRRPASAAWRCHHSKALSHARM